VLITDYVRHGTLRRVFGNDVDHVGAAYDQGGIIVRGRSTIAPLTKLLCSGCGTCSTSELSLTFPIGEKTLNLGQHLKRWCAPRAVVGAEIDARKRQPEGEKISSLRFAFIGRQGVPADNLLRSTLRWADQAT
jgi:hypothetical protein